MQRYPAAALHHDSGTGKEQENADSERLQKLQKKKGRSVTMVGDSNQFSFQGFRSSRKSY
jgi:hypothetical protein